MVTREDVEQAYRAVLKREVESEAMIDLQRSHHPSLDGLISTLLDSAEYQLRRPVRTPLDRLFDGLNPEDEALLQRHLVHSEPEADYVKSFVGVRMRVSHNDSLKHLSGACYNDIPTRVGDYHAEPIEFVGMLRAVEAAGDSFVGVELGAGWGSWSVAAGHVARACGRDPIRLYAVEASAGKVANMRTHYADNGFDPAAHTLVNAIVGPRDGYALFPLADVTGHWGESALFTDDDQERAGYERVRSISLATLLKDEPVVDMIHFDIQGAEGDVIPEAAELLTARARYLIVGTHGRSIEGRIVDTLLPLGWTLENDQPARVRHSVKGAEALYVDGTQVWRNPAL